MATFEGWACIELFGHRVVYGHVSEVTAFGATFARIEIPTDPPKVEFKNPSAIYGFAPRTEEECRKQNEPWKPRPALSAPVDADLVDDDPQDEPDETCGYCGELLGVEPIEDVAIGDGSESAFWHKRCAEEHAKSPDGWSDDKSPGPVDSDIPRSPP